MPRTSEFDQNLPVKTVKEFFTAPEDCRRQHFNQELVEIPFYSQKPALKGIFSKNSSLQIDFKQSLRNPIL